MSFSLNLLLRRDQLDSTPKQDTGECSREPLNSRKLYRNVFSVLYTGGVAGRAIKSSFSPTVWSMAQMLNNPANQSIINHTYPITINQQTHPFKLKPPSSCWVNNKRVDREKNRNKEYWASLIRHVQISFNDAQTLSIRHEHLKIIQAQQCASCYQGCILYGWGSSKVNSAKGAN